MWVIISSILLSLLPELTEGSSYCLYDPTKYCTYGCCSYSYGLDCCDYSVVYAWWFWFVWGLFFLLMVISCGCALRRRNQMTSRRRNVVVVRSYPGYGSTVTGAETPQYPYTQPYPGGYYNPGYGQVPQGYAQPPPGAFAQPPQGAYAQPPQGANAQPPQGAYAQPPQGANAQLPVYSAQPPAGSEQSKPPPYNPNPAPDTQSQAQNQNQS